MGTEQVMRHKTCKTYDDDDDDNDDDDDDDDACIVVVVVVVWGEGICTSSCIYLSHFFRYWT
jgi:hypothetical protein